MSMLRLTVKKSFPGRVDMRPLTDSGVLAKGPEAVGRLRVQAYPGKSGAGKMPLGDLFAIEGTALCGHDDDQLIITGDCGKLDGLGAGWQAGNVLVEGDCGDHLGEKMAGGTIHVGGDVGSRVGCGMAGGRIDIAGNAGDLVGAALLGQRVGMTGGVICILGRAGDRLGERMRRGSVLVAGDVGAHCGARLIAGTICVLGMTGPGLGLMMRRGTVLLSARPPALAPTFQDCGSHDLPFFALLMKYIGGFGGPFTKFSRKPGRCLRKYAGDIGVGGQGEILIPDPSS